MARFGTASSILTSPTLASLREILLWRLGVRSLFEALRDPLPRQRG